jgi:hypothetical protein
VTNSSTQPRTAILDYHMSKFWSGDLGLTLVTICLAALVFVIFPLRSAGLPGRFFLDLAMLTLMVSGVFAVRQSRLVTALVIAVVVAGAVALWLSWSYPAPAIQELGSFLSIITALLYLRIVLLIMFRGGPVTWSRIQGAVCAYLLIGLTWASAFRLMEQMHPGSFHFVTPPEDVGQLSSKLVYFSFATLTSVGGEVTPLHPFARSLAIAEAVVGQLFPAILIGALVAMAMQARANHDHAPASDK